MYFLITPISLGVNILMISFLRIRQDATASLILLWKVTTTGFKQCSLIDGRSVTLLQALGGLVLSEEMLALGNNYFIGEWHADFLFITSRSRLMVYPTVRETNVIILIWVLLKDPGVILGPCFKHLVHWKQTRGTLNSYRGGIVQFKN